MKKYYLVKGDERHEVHDYGNWIRLRDSTHNLNKTTAEALGYKLEEVLERREYWVAYTDILTGKVDVFYNEEIARHCHKDAIKVVELHPNERIVSREDVESAWNCCGFEGDDCVDALIEELGFEDGAE